MADSSDEESQSYSHLNASDSDDASSENEVRKIRQIAHAFSNAKERNDRIAFGFEGMPSSSNADKPRKAFKRKKDPKPTSEAQKRQKSSSVLMQTNTKNVESSTSNANNGGGGGANDDTSFWKPQKHSKTKYVLNYFVSNSKPCAGKVDVVCKLCGNGAKPLSITIGNNSNMVKHLKTVSCCCRFCY